MCNTSPLLDQSRLGCQPLEVPARPKALVRSQPPQLQRLAAYPPRRQELFLRQHQRLDIALRPNREQLVRIDTGDASAQLPRSQLLHHVPPVLQVDGLYPAKHRQGLILAQSHVAAFQHDSGVDFRTFVRRG